MTLYLDQASTTKPEQEVINEMMPYLTDMWHNPSNLYSQSVQIKTDIENARKAVAKFIHADSSSEIIFTSGASESNSTILQGFVLNRIAENKRVGIIISAVEHHSIMECVKYLNKLPDVVINIIGVDENCYVKHHELKESIEDFIENGIDSENIIVSVIHANNETGVINDVKSISELCHSYGCYIHTDATQSLPHINVDVKHIKVDALSASGHKLGAPKGIGFLYVKDGLGINPLIYGSQENERRGGTENVPYIIGLAKALNVLKSENYCRLGTMQQLYYIRSYFVDRLKKIKCKVNAEAGTTIPTCINVKLPGVSGEAMMYMLDSAGIQVSTGSACNSKSISSSHVLKAIGLADEEAAQCIRISFSEDISLEEIDYCVDEMNRCIKLLRGETIDASILDVNY